MSTLFDLTNGQTGTGGFIPNIASQNGVQTSPLLPQSKLGIDIPFGGINPDLTTGGNVPNVGLLEGDSVRVRYKVRLVSVIGLATAFQPGDINSVVFEVTPTFTESGGVEYTSVQPIHMPGSIQTYKYTNSRTFSITAHLISRNTADALKNIKYLQTLRAWRYPYFGNSATTNKTSAGSSLGQMDGPNSVTAQQISNPSSGELLGAPPEVLYLYAYSTSANDGRGFDYSGGVNINRVPVVLSSLTINYPEDVDYLPISLTPSAQTEPFPVKMDIQITLLEAHSPNEFQRFSLQAYKTGNLPNF
jgi:hypothetical protein